MKRSAFLTAPLALFGAVAGLGAASCFPSLDALTGGSGTADAADTSTPVVDAAIKDSNASDAVDSAVSPFLGGGTLIYTSSFQDGTIPIQWFVDAKAADSVTVVPAPWSQARKAVSFLIRPGETQPRFSYPISQISLGAPKLPRNSQLGFVSAFSVPADTILPSNNVILAVINAGACCGAPFILHVMNGILKVAIGSDSYLDDVSAGPVPRGQRVPIEIVFHPSTGPDGLLRVAIGDKLIVERKGPSVYAAETEDYYLQLSANADGKDISAAFTAYWDDLTVFRY